MDEQKIAELFSKESFIQAMMQADSPEKLQKLFSENGLEFSPAEIASIKKALEADSGEGDLTDDDLESVAGGTSLSSKLKGALAIMKKLIGSGQVILKPLKK